MNWSMRVEGGEELARHLRAMPSRVSRRIQIDALLAGAAPIQRAARAMAPHEPGSPDLKVNINTAVVRGGFEGHPAVGIGVPKGFFYDWFQEFGTTRHGAQPFYRPALDSEGGRAIKAITSDLWTSLAGRGIGRVLDVPSVVESDGPLL